MILDKDDAEALLSYAIKNNLDTQNGIAKKLDVISRTVRKWKTGRDQPNASNLEDLKELFEGNVHVCIWCGEAFEPKNNKQDFCSSKCEQDYKEFRQDDLEDLQLDTPYNSRTVEKKCAYCGETFEGHVTKKYCSEKCQTLNQINPNYYTVFYRDKFRCRYCGKTPADGIKLTIDHVYPKSKNGSNKLFNLVTACQKCNSHKKDTVWNKQMIKEIWWQNKKLQENEPEVSYEEILKEFQQEYPEKTMPNPKGG